MRPAALVISRCDKVSVRWSQRHEHPKDDDADQRHQDEIAEGFHRCLCKARAIVFASLPGLITLLVALASVRDLLFCAKHLFVAATDGKRPQPLTAGAS